MCYVLTILFRQDGKECKDLLNINPELDMEIRNEFVNAYYSEYWSILFCLRRLFYSKQGNLHDIIKFSSKDIVRPSNTVFLLC